MGQGVGPHNKKAPFFVRAHPLARRRQAWARGRARQARGLQARGRQARERQAAACGARGACAAGARKARGLGAGLAVWALGAQPGRAG